MAFKASSSELKTLAEPSNFNIFWSTADCVATLPSRAKVPFNIAIPPSLWTGAFLGLMISLFNILVPY